MLGSKWHLALPLIVLDLEGYFASWDPCLSDYDPSRPGTTENLLYCLGANELEVFDITEPASIRKLSHLDLPRLQEIDFQGWEGDFAVGESMLYIVANGALAIDISNPELPYLIAQLPATNFEFGSPRVFGDSQGANHHR